MSPDLRHIHTFEQLVRYLEDELGWPLEGYDVEDLTFDYEADELGLKPSEAAKVKSIRQLRPLTSSQPWGIFFIEFDRKRLPVVVLRRILSHLVVKKRASANKAHRAAWQAHDVLFISAFGPEDDDGREIAFAHFHQEDGDLPTLRVLGWDGGDTILTLNHVAGQLHDRLHWPEPGETLDQWRARWSGAFRHRLGHVIRTADELADALALLARGIRDAARTLMVHESERGPLRKLHHAFQTTLIHDLTEEGFADTYAQTITYGLLIAALQRTDLSGGKEATYVKADDLTGIVRVTSPFIREMLETFLKVGGRKGGIDFDELGVQDVVELLRGEETDLPAILRDFGNKTRGEDPVIHFYEHFLSAYNKQLKIQRGVFYTPQPVVSYIVRSVHELLQTEFGLEDGLASTVTWGEMVERSKSAASTSAKGSARAPRAVSGAPAGNIEKTVGAAAIQSDAARAGGGSSAGAPKTTREGAYAPLQLPPLTDDPDEKRTISPDEPFVQILDIATGTGTFIAEVIEVIHQTMVAKWKKAGMTAAQIQQAWNEYVPRHLLPRVYGFELMMSAYVIAHLKVGLKLSATGFNAWSQLDPDKDRVRIYLTNTLEPPDDRQAKLIGFDALAHEAAAVNEIKWYKRFTVVIGNPPYSLMSANLEETQRRLIDAYRTVDGVRIKERGALQLEKNLQDDYVKFIRFSQMQCDLVSASVFGMVTNHSYIENPTLRGLRRSLMRTFSQMSLLDLHGNSKRKEVCPLPEQDQNVFDIQQGVAIGVFLRRSDRSENTTVKWGELWGSRDRKYSVLHANSYGDLSTIPVQPTPPLYLFVAQDEKLKADFDEGLPLDLIFGLYSTGIATARDGFSVQFTKEAIQSVISTFPRLDPEVAREQFSLGPDTNDWKIELAQNDVRRTGGAEKNFAQYLYRPFDRRFTYYTGKPRGFHCNPRRPVMQQLIVPGNLALCVAKAVESGRGFSHVFVTRTLSDHHCVSLKEVNYILPLLTRPFEEMGEQKEQNLWDYSRQSQDEKPTPNFTVAFARLIQSKLKYCISYSDACGSDEISAADCFGFIYAVLFSATYRARYAEFLKKEFARIPIPANRDLFLALARLGGELTALHLLESPKLAQPITEFIGGRNPEVEKPSWSKNTVWIDKDQTIGFKGVREDVWNFHIGGYQVCEKWLKDRKGRNLSADDRAHYQKIVTALSETIRLMKEIDKLIEKHGGWPGAFAAGSSAARTGCD